jgi:hypothetical protein
MSKTVVDATEGIAAGGTRDGTEEVAGYHIETKDVCARTGTS